jgi:hypothetical protein
MTDIAISPRPIAVLRSAFETELYPVVDRLLGMAAAEAEAVGERERATGRAALEAAQAALDEERRRNDGLTESLLQSEIQVEELRLKLQTECERAKAATEAHASEQRARARAEAASAEAQTVREQIVSAYESQLQMVHGALGAAQAESASLKQQLETETAERARLVNAFRTVQQACAVAESHGNPSDDRLPVDAPAADGTAARDARTSVNQPHHDEPVPATPDKSDRRLKLVTPTEAPTFDAPPQVVEYFNELFEQIEAMYHIDERGHASVDVVERLCANLRYAREVFLQRAQSAGAAGAPLFDHRLSKKLDELGPTALGRHLAIAAYELTDAAAAPIHAEAS